MTSTLGTPENPLRVAIIGAGPSAFYAAEHLLKKLGDGVKVDMFEHLPTPFGLVRGGVAPDHAKIKSVTRVYDRIASHPNYRFFGNVTYGKDISHDDLQKHYHAVIYAVGAQADRKLGIPGEDLPGNHPATEFVAWYNGHPDYRDLQFDLSQERAAVIGIGNVAMDVARILARTDEELRATDIADYALEALAQSKVKEIYLLGRRGPVQAKFTPKELKEMGELAAADLIIDPRDLELDPASKEYLETANDRDAQRNYELLQEFAQRPPSGKPKKIYLRFLTSPVEVLGTERVEGLKVVRNELYKRDDGSIRPRPTDEHETLPVGLVFRSIGYRGVPLPDVPFDDWYAVIPNDKGRVMQDDQQVIGEYAVGWIKRGPTGVIGTNKPCAQESVNMLLEDMQAGKVFSPEAPAPEAVEALLRERGVRYVTYDDWRILDQLEVERGKAAGRPRVKFTSVEEMLAALDAHKA